MSKPTLTQTSFDDLCRCGHPRSCHGWQFDKTDCCADVKPRCDCERYERKESDRKEPMAEPTFEWRNGEGHCMGLVVIEETGRLGFMPGDDYYQGNLSLDDTRALLAKLAAAHSFLLVSVEPSQPPVKRCTCTSAAMHAVLCQSKKT